MPEAVDLARRVTNAVGIPVVADMDTGYGNPLNVVRTVEQCVAADVGGIILEDQEWPKKCGHFEGKRVIPLEDHVQKIRAAVDARSGHDLVLIARTDARAPLGMDEAINRGRAYRDAGADVVFIEAPRSMDDLDTIVGAFSDVPLFANMIEGGSRHS
jgi:methylisocitrate lyase